MKCCRLAHRSQLQHVFSVERSCASGINGGAAAEANNGCSASGAVYIFDRAGTSWSQQAYVKPSNINTGDAFGDSVALSNDTLVVGAPGEDSCATGVNGGAAAEAGNTCGSAGAIYVFTRAATTWSQQAYIKASNADLGDAFGSAVDIDGDTLAVAAPFERSGSAGVQGPQDDSNPVIESGAAYVFTRSGIDWSQQSYIKASNPEYRDEFGHSVAISGDRLVVGAWLEDSSALGVNGEQSNNSAPNSGAGYLFARSGSSWSQLAYLKASNAGDQDYFGWATAIDGDFVVVGAWQEQSNAQGVNCGGTCAPQNSGGQTDNSEDRAGATYIFDLTP